MMDAALENHGWGDPYETKSVQCVQCKIEFEIYRWQYEIDIEEGTQDWVCLECAKLSAMPVDYQDTLNGAERERLAMGQVFYSIP